MTAEPPRFDDDGYVDMTAFEATDPDSAVAPDVLAALERAFASESADTTTIADDAWGELLDGAFEAQPEPSTLDLLDPMGETGFGVVPAAPIDLESGGAYEGRSAEQALESARAEDGSVGAGEAREEGPVRLDDGVGPDDDRRDLDADTDPGADRLPDWDIDLDDGSADVDLGTDDDGTADILDLDDTY
jgi:hypothetical protein